MLICDGDNEFDLCNGLRALPTLLFEYGDGKCCGFVAIFGDEYGLICAEDVSSYIAEVSCLGNVWFLLYDDGLYYVVNFQNIETDP